MDYQHILQHIDHTLLTQTCTKEEIINLCDEGVKYNVASVCIPPSYVRFAKEYVGSKLSVCTVIGFPNGYHTTETKIFEARDAIKNGADEIDMVINLGYVKNRRYDLVESEIQKIKQVCGDKILKVIIETCFLTNDEKIELCKAVTNAKADFIKTSTGFGSGGATLEDVQLFKKFIGANVKIKAAGGIRSIEVAQRFIDEGTARLGTSAIIKLLNDQEATGY